MTRTDRLRTEVRRLAPAGDTAEFRATFARFMAASTRRPWWERAGTWYMGLPHNRLVFIPMFNWVESHPWIAIPAAGGAVVVEFVLLLH